MQWLFSLSLSFFSIFHNSTDGVVLKPDLFPNMCAVHQEINILERVKLLNIYLGQMLKI